MHINPIIKPTTPNILPKYPDTNPVKPPKLFSASASGNPSSKSSLHVFVDSDLRWGTPHESLCADY